MEQGPRLYRAFRTMLAPEKKLVMAALPAHMHKHVEEKTGMGSSVLAGHMAELIKHGIVEVSREKKVGRPTTYKAADKAEVIKSIAMSVGADEKESLEILRVLFGSKNTMAIVEHLDIHPGCTVSSIVEGTGLSPQNISQYLRLLKKHGLMSSQRLKTRRICGLTAKYYAIRRSVETYK